MVTWRQTHTQAGSGVQACRATSGNRSFRSFLSHVTDDTCGCQRLMTDAMIILAEGGKLGMALATVDLTQDRNAVHILEMVIAAARFC